MAIQRQKEKEEEKRHVGRDALQSTNGSRRRKLCLSLGVANGRRIGYFVERNGNGGYSFMRRHGAHPASISKRFETLSRDT
jgi:hypothetical protein